MRMRGERNARSDRRLRGIVRIDVLVRERGVQGGEHRTRVGFVANAASHARRERGARDAGDAKRVEIALNHVDARLALAQFGGNR